MTLNDLLALAIEWCPADARWDHMLDKARSWGASHELAHALIEPAWRWTDNNYQRCPLGFCACSREECTVYEAAAMMISHRLVAAAGAPQLTENEIQNTPDYDLIYDEHWQRAKALLKRKKLWPVPRTKRSLERALRRRLRSPQGGPVPPHVSTTWRPE